LFYEWGTPCRGKLIEILDPENTYIEPGKVYRAIIKIKGVKDGELTEDRAREMIANIISDVKKQYGGSLLALNITYVKIKDDEVVVDFYDDPGVPVVVYYIVLAIIAVIGLYLIVEGLDKICLILGQFIEKLPKVPEMPKWFWYVLGVVGIGLGLSLIGIGIKRIITSFRFRR